MACPERSPLLRKDFNPGASFGADYSASSPAHSPFARQEQKSFWLDVMSRLSKTAAQKHSTLRFSGWTPSLRRMALALRAF